MNAAPLLAEIARRLEEAGLEAVLIGNAAAALQGAPVTTLDLDFLIRRSPLSIRGIKRVAKLLGAVVLRPCYPVSDLFRVVRDDDGMQIDFMGTIHGIRSFEGLRRRASSFDFAGSTLWVASLDDVIKSKRAAGRPRDLAVLDLLEKTREEKAR